MTLPHKTLGQPHLAAHNEERDAINTLLASLGSGGGMPDPGSAPTGYVLTVQSDGTAAFSALKSPGFVIWDGTGSAPPRPVTASGVPVFWMSPVAIPGGGTYAGGAGKVDGVDILLKTP